MASPGTQPGTIRFEAYELDPAERELRKRGKLVKLQPQQFAVLLLLVERAGQTVSREEIHQHIWGNDTFVDFERGINFSINQIRAALGDDADEPRFIETLPRRGYRFIAALKENPAGQTTAQPVVNPSPSNEASPVGGSSGASAVQSAAPAKHARFGATTATILIGSMLAVAGMVAYKKLHPPVVQAQRTLTRLTFDDGLQIGATWSPDSRYIAYSSDRGGKFDIWVQQVTGGDPVQITKSPGNNWQPDWSPDGKYIAYRSEDGEGGLFVIPSLGGEGQQRKIASFGYYPRWSPDSSQVLFQTTRFVTVRLYLVGVNGGMPREVPTNFLSPRGHEVVSANWYPDGKRISAWLSGQMSDSLVPVFWTIPVAGGAAVRSEIPPELARQLIEASNGKEPVDSSGDFKFSWAPSGTAIYFERTLRGVRNLWRMTVDRTTLRATAIDRLTTGPGMDTESAVSPDGKQLAFTGGAQHKRAWLFPFNAVGGRITGQGSPVTSVGIDVFEPNLSPDGKQLIFMARRAGKWDLMTMSLQDRREIPLLPDDDFPYDPLWSPDSKRLAYVRWMYSTKTSQVMMWSTESRNQNPVTDVLDGFVSLYEWSVNGDQLVLSMKNAGTGRRELWLLPMAAAPHAQVAAKKLLSDPDGSTHQGHISPDGQWIAFEVVRVPSTGATSTLYAMRTAGGPWIPLTGGQQWDDKPRWSPDGKIIYFLSGRRGFFNIWGIHFDTATGKPSGEPFQVTHFNSPNLMVSDNVAPVDISLTRNLLVVPVEQVSGSIWVLNNVDR